MNSSLFSSIPGLAYGFLASHEPDAKKALNEAAPSIATMKQVHGANLEWVETVEKGAREADALATFTPGLKIGVYSADCTPVLVAALGNTGRPLAVMAVHAGWRGTAANISSSAFQEFVLATLSKASAYRALIGPCISFQSFEVGEEVVQAFPGSEARGLARFLGEKEGKRKYLFDLPGENRRQLQEIAGKHGLDFRLDQIPLCTLASPLPSYRRDKEKAGRILSYLAIEG